MTFSLWCAFVISCVLFSFSPGAGAISTMSTSMNYGPRAALANIFGLELALGVHILVAAVGLGMLLASSAWAFTVLKTLGACYLIWLGIQKWRESPDFESEQGLAVPVSFGKRVRSGILINLTNPKSIIFLAAFLPQFIRVEPSLPLQYLILGVTVLVVDALVMVSYTFLAASLRRMLTSEKSVKFTNAVFGMVFIGAGAALLSASRSS